MNKLTNMAIKVLVIMALAILVISLGTAYIAEHVHK